jgi:radical SAM protein with 4Fe4S-binding SPASM domain
MADVVTVRIKPDDFGFTVRPLELKIEITESCDLSCSFCYQGGASRRVVRHMPSDDVFRWIDWAVDNGIPGVRFTGGEPTLHPEIKALCNYAYLRKCYVILNTNGMARQSLYQELFTVVSDVRVSLPVLNAGRLDAITGGKNVLENKMACIRQALASVPRTSILTTLLPENKGKLEGFVRLVLKHAGLSWLPLRYEPSPDVPQPWTRQDAQEFAEEIAGLMHRYPDHVPGILLAVPFCSVKPVSLGARVFAGKITCCGPYVALNVNIDGALDACFGVCDLSARSSLEEIIDSPELMEICSLSSLPEPCQNCQYVSRCAGGCRKPFGMVTYKGKYVDYLAGFINGNPAMSS